MAGSTTLDMGKARSLTASGALHQPAPKSAGLPGGCRGAARIAEGSRSGARCKRAEQLLADLKLSGELGLPIRIPAGSLAQSWRGGPRSDSIARLLQHASTVVTVDESPAKQIGVFLAHLRRPETEKPDVVDAHVALATRTTGSLVWTSDPSDMTRYGVQTKFVRKL